MGLIGFYMRVDAASHTTPQQSRPQGPPRLRPRARLAPCHSDTILHSDSYRDFPTSDRRIQPHRTSHPNAEWETPTPALPHTRTPLAHTLSSNSNSNSAAGTTRTPVTTPGSDANGPTLRLNRKSVDLPGLNTFAPPPPRPRRRRAPPAGGGLAREGRGSGSTTNGNGSISVNVNINDGHARGRGGTPPPRSAAIAISQRANGHGHGEETDGVWAARARIGGVPSPCLSLVLRPWTLSGLPIKPGSKDGGDAMRAITQLGLEADMDSQGPPPPYEEPPAYEPLASPEYNEEHGAADENETNAGMGNTTASPKSRRRSQRRPAFSFTFVKHGRVQKSGGEGACVVENRMENAYQRISFLLSTITETSFEDVQLMSDLRASSLFCPSNISEPRLTNCMVYTVQWNDGVKTTLYIKVQSEATQTISSSISESSAIPISRSRIESSGWSTIPVNSPSKSIKENRTRFSWAGAG
ncbi:hypothetical protein B0H14DRAFT_2595187 [Mycena olivaceomarginata]|nr:hypothetical protein B0H14DRAFT_2595187 [Mycena olivaceomarginata]